MSVVLDLSEKPEGVFLDVQQVEGESDFELPAVSSSVLFLFVVSICLYFHLPRSIALKTMDT